MREGNTPEDQHATNDYMAIQDCIYNITNQYESQGKYEFFIMLAGEMLHQAAMHGNAIGMSEAQVLSELADELDDQKGNQEAINRAKWWMEQWEKAVKL